MTRPSPYSGRVTLVTGASSGIGAALAQHLASQGARLALFARREDRLEALAGPLRAQGTEVLVLPGDVTDLAAVKAAHQTIVEKLGPVEVAFLNAGVGDTFSLARFETSRLRPMFEVNVFGLVHWLECLLPPMTAARSGLVVGLSSLAAHFGAPRSEAYSASKAAVTNLLQGLRIQARAVGVTVCTVEPGFVRTEMTDKNRFHMPFLIEPAQAARTICRGAARGRRVIRFPWPMALGVQLLRLLPLWLLERLLATSVRPPAK